MIVVDANIIAYRVLANDRATSAMRLFDIDGEWISPSLWEYEFNKR
jgi:predicted nucleic acid-binding protein